MLYSYIKEFVNPEDELINEWSIYCGDNYWTDKQQNLPLLSRIALGYIWLPVSGVDVEQSFSHCERAIPSLVVRLNIYTRFLVTLLS